MEMTYRGVRYQANYHAVEVKKSVNEVNKLCYRGTVYQQSNSFVNFPKVADDNLVYRGVSVNTGKKIHFLGRTCQQRKIVFSPVTA